MSMYLFILVLSVISLLSSGLPAQTLRETVDSLMKAEPDLSDSDSGEVNLRDKRAVHVSPTPCLKKLYVMAFTSGIIAAESTMFHNVELLVNNHSRHVRMHDLPGIEYTKNRGDLWKIDFSQFNFPEPCINLSEIKRVYIFEGGNDGWNIDSIVTFVLDINNKTQILTQDLDVNKWVDGDDLISRRRLELTKV